MSSDDQDELRGPLLTNERLLEHAAALAHAHGEPAQVRLSPLKPRFEQLRIELREAYVRLSRDVRARREPSPSEEWLLDNAHVVEDQAREVATDLPWGYLVKLPRLGHGPYKGYPRVYALCLDYLRHTDARVEAELLIDYVRAYGAVRPLTIGELWAVPIMLRLGLLRIVTRLALAAAADDHEERGRKWAERLTAIGDGGDINGALAALSREKVTPELLVELERRLREHDAPSEAAIRWVRERAVGLGASIDELGRRRHLARAADQLSVGNAITSMRAISGYAWPKFFQATSAVEALLVCDPARVYSASHDETRDRCRHVVESIARKSPCDEVTVASAALELAQAASDKLPLDPARAHVGYYLIGPGRAELERTCGTRVPLAQRARRLLERNASAAYLGALFFSTALGVGAVWLGLGALGAAPWLRVLLAGLLVCPIADAMLALINTLAVMLVPPRLLPRLDFERGIPEEHRTLVAVPCLLDDERTIDALLADLEIRALANPDERLSYALLTDFVDAGTEHCQDDAALLAYVQAGLVRLNERHGTIGVEAYPRFALFHRKRVHNAAEGRYMGWERKRGKLEELNRLLRGRGPTTFVVVTAPEALLRAIKYVITLDADTELPRGTAQKMVATLGHPLNRPVLDERQQRVTRGYAILQPRVGTTPGSTRKTRFARIMAGPLGIDPYTLAVSDVYQDLFGEGSFNGKGIYDVDAFARAIEGRIRDNTVLSHDLLESLFARAALVSDIEVLDEQPTTYEVAARRQHRWTRGDWQLLPWALGAAKGMTALGRFKLLDNLRRSLVAPGLIAAMLISAWLVPAAAPYAVALLVLVLTAPLSVRLVTELVRATPSQLGSIWGGFLPSLKQSAVHGALMLDQALFSLDAIARTLYRLAISRRGLLEWQSMGEVQRFFSRSGMRVEPRLWLSSVLSVVALFVTAQLAPSALPFLAPVLFLWALSPFTVLWLARPVQSSEQARALAPEGVLELRALARRTWHFFETFVTAQDNYLPPDNYQEEPRGVVAHRTSPTNIGLYLLSVVAARDFGFITASEVVRRLGQTLDTLHRFERREGHILNWYETNTLKPLEPRYVSTVDSGNLAAYLWTLKAGCDELITRPLIGPELIAAIEDAILLAQAEQGTRTDGLLQLAQEQRAAMTGELRSALVALEQLQAALAARADVQRGSEWLARARDTAAHARAELLALAPFAALREPPAVLATGALGERFAPIRATLAAAKTPAQLAALPLAELAVLRDEAGLDAEAARYLSELSAAIEDGSERAALLIEQLAVEGTRAQAFADGMSFSFLLDQDRMLFSIGYNVGAAKLDGSHYDLLASEARLASLFAIAKGDVPEKHWFRLGRPRTSLGDKRALLAWSGSMFEYLMPLLVTKNNPDTLLYETCESAVLAHQDYGNEHDVPWGISEAAYNIMDLSMTYQYRAFGVPSLGLKAGLGDDHVIAPYATVLAAQVRPDLAITNLHAIAREGGISDYGCYESIDYTKARVPPGRKGVVVKAYFAHHQGMSLVALDNVVNDAPMLRRFHSDPRVQATELLLEERVPTTAPVLRDRIMRSPAPPAAEGELSAVEHVGLSALSQPRAHLLGHGELATLITARGTGFTTWRKLDAHRYRQDSQLEPSGIFIYVRDRTEGATWSAGYEPTRATPSSYDAAFAPHRVDIQRKDGSIETHLHVTVSPEHPADVRRLTLINHGPTPRELEVTTYTEIVLAERAADRAHRAFSGMFVETELVTQRPSMRPSSASGASEPPRARSALLATRRPRKGGELQPWLTQVLACETGDWSDLEHETSREAFIGRGRSLQSPRALDEGVRLGARDGGVIDPAFALRRVVKLAPGEHATITLTTALASSRAEAVDLSQLFSAQSTIDRTFELAWADATVELRHLGISANQSHRFQRLLTAVHFPQPSLRAEVPIEHLHGDGRRVLWSQGLSDDLPLIIARIDETSPGELCRELLLAHEFFRLNHEQVELCLLSEEQGGYLQPVHDATLALVHGRLAHAQLDQRGGIFVRRTSHLSPQERALLLAAGRVVLQVGHGSLSRQLRRAAERTASLAPVLPVREADSGLQPVTRASRPSAPERPSLLFDNGFGGFSEDGREYVMQLSAKKRPPAPWCNVIASPMFGTLVSEAGGGFTWSQNSQRHRITAWSNDATRDPACEVIYLRDDEDGSVWSATPAPAGGEASYTVRHGQGYSAFSHTRARLEHELVVSIDFERPVKLFKLTLRNSSDRARSISIVGFVDWVLGAHRDVSRTGVVTRWDKNVHALFASGFLSAFPHRVAFFASSELPRSVTADRSELFGDGDAARPRALERTALSGHTGFGFEPCAALHTAVHLPPGAQHVVSFALGEGESAEAALSLARAFGEISAVDAAIANTKAQWDALLGSVQVQTPDLALDVLLNRFLPYQVLSCRFWARSAFYQSGGAYGFRDQLQDVLALLHMRPDLAREHILRSAARQFVQGDVQHWWHPDTGEGVRTRCSDDMLWLPFATAEYVRVTGDRAILDERVPFLEERQLEESDHDIYGVPRTAEADGTLYEHCLRALDVGLTAGEHGLPLMRGGDWNDGMDRVGVLGKGESVWLGFFIARVLLDFAEVARQYGDAACVQKLIRARERLAVALEEHGWDGAWYRRAFCDDGTLLGSAQSPECRIDAIAQSWAVISGCASSERAVKALEQAEAQLLKDDVMLLLTPPFTGAVADPGYIRAYPPGVRENGGQYTHGALWMVQALAQLGEHERAYSMLCRLNPIHHARTEAQVARYRIEPYVIAADVYYAPGLEGRGGWSWYTGAAGWLYRIALEHVLGFSVRDGFVQIAPVAPRKLERYRIRYKNKGTTLDIEVERGAQETQGVWLDGQRVEDGRAPMPSDGRTHTLKVTLGPIAPTPVSVPVRESAE